MTYFTDSPYEKMMMQKPQYRRGKSSTASDDKKSENRDKPDKESVPVPKERCVKE